MEFNHLALKTRSSFCVVGPEANARRTSFEIREGTRVVGAITAQNSAKVV
jgi:hypothetical protein